MDENSKLENIADWQKRLAQITEYAEKFLKTTANDQAFFPLRVEDSYDEPEWAKVQNESSRGLPEILEDIDEHVIRRGINPTAGAFMGYVPGGGVPDAALGDFIAALTNRYSGVFRASPGAVDIENALLQWFIERLNFPKSSWGTLTSGGTTADIVCLIAARATLEFHDWQRAVIYFSEETHHCLQRALIVTGLQGVKQHSIAVDEQFRLDCKELRQAIERDRAQGLIPWLVVGNAGTVNTGALDPLDEIHKIARKEKLWFHIDAAYGGCFAFLEEESKSFAGLAKADSVILDPHKGFFQPYGLGVALVREGDRLKSELTYSADYLADVEDGVVPSPADYSLELTRHFRGLRLWLCLQLHGAQSFHELQREKLKLARSLHAKLSERSNIDCGPDPHLSIVTFRWRDLEDAGQMQRLQKLLDRGMHLSSTRLRGKIFLRVCILNFRTHQKQVDQLLATIDNIDS